MQIDQADDHNAAFLAVFTPKIKSKNQNIQTASQHLFLNAIDIKYSERSLKGSTPGCRFMTAGFHNMPHKWQLIMNKNLAIQINSVFESWLDLTWAQLYNKKYIYILNKIKCVDKKNGKWISTSVLQATFEINNFFFIIIKKLLLQYGGACCAHVGCVITTIMNKLRIFYTDINLSYIHY